MEDDCRKLRGSVRKKEKSLRWSESENQCTFSRNTPWLRNPKPAKGSAPSGEQLELTRTCWKSSGNGQVLPEPPHSLLALNQALW